MMNSWKINFLNEYQHLTNMVDNPYNNTTQVRKIILGTNPSGWETLLQDITSRDIEKLYLDSFNDTSNIIYVSKNGIS